MGSKLPPSMREGGTLVSQVHQLAGRIFSRILKEHGLDEINPAQGRILYALWKRDGIMQNELASVTRLDKSTLALMLDRLEQDGWIERITDSSDARKKTVRATAGTLSLHDRYEKASAEMISVFYGDLPESRVDSFEATLREILVNLERALELRG